MTDFSPRFVLPLLQPGQAQKELFHNEALALIDAGLWPVAETIGDDTLPISPAIGQYWIVGTAPGGDWSGMANRLAAWTAGGWRFVMPVRGMLAWIVPSGFWHWFDGAAWMGGVLPTGGVSVGGQQVLAARQAAIAGPGGGGVIDVEARAAIADILVALRNHGLVAV